MGGLLSPAERDAQFRSFQFMGAVAPEVTVGCAVTHTQSGLTAFAYGWRDPDFTQVRLAGREGDVADFAPDPDDGTTELRTSRGTVLMTADPNDGKRLVVESDTLNIDLRFAEDNFDTLRLATPTGPTGWAYVQKVAAVPALGTCLVGGVEIDLETIGAQAHHDYTTGFLRPETWWHWACVAARLPDGRRLGLNVSCGTNESGYRENCLWLDGVRTDLGGALFEFDPDDTETPWRVVGTRDEFELVFTPDHGYHARGESASMATNFHQLFGRFDGRILGPDGRIEVAGLPGFTESQYLRW